MMRIFVTCNDQPLRFEPPDERPQNEFEGRMETMAAEGFEDLAQAMAYAHMHVGYAIGGSDIPVHLNLDQSDFVSPPNVSFQESGEGIWEMKIGPLLYVAKLR
ncbi:hypothetical protein [Methylobacterium nodulans]|uniref:Uncharacterized protein n=1 Tax=Methylobacterium nodulans (strain LMG 21967 / CNCM I-2342 / ORS 2060) TaxID=460265 RepID=B8IHR1_METNO|nr:hypothetical protein [Methylobacterium nodulans]ACL55949.1 hypothetical protein Mnod_0931 [Methylobacterium nodulans ORS 2060]